MKLLLKFILNIPVNAVNLIFIFFKVFRCYVNSLVDKDFALSVIDENENENEVLILGNGPSLKEIDFSKIKNNISLACVNFFAIKSQFFFRIKPKYYFLLDPVFFLPKAKISDYYRDMIKDLYAKLDLVDWNIIIVVPQYSYLRFANSHIKIQKINMNIVPTKKNNIFFNFLYSKNLLSCGCQNVLVGALFYFILKKIPNIYVAGCDMSEFTCYHVDAYNHVIANFSHFYKDDIVDCTETGVIKLGDFSNYLYCYCKMLFEFKTIKFFSDYQGVNITNLSLDSYIDVFEKKSWKILLNDKK